MSSNATAATARLVTATAKAAAPGARFVTTSQGPYSFRVVLHDTLLSGLTPMQAAGLATHALQGVDGGSRFTATWGTDHRTGKLVISVTDEPAREAAVAELGAAREAALVAARAEVAAAQPELGGLIVARGTVHRLIGQGGSTACGLYEPAARTAPDARSATCAACLDAEATDRARALTPEVARPALEHVIATAAPRTITPAAGQLPTQAEVAAPRTAEAHYTALAEQAQAAVLASPRLCAYCTRSALPGEAECEEHLDTTDALPLAANSEQWGSTDSHRAPAPATLPCYHVTCASGRVYGVAATSVRDALTMTQDRLSGEGSTDLPKGARKVGRWAAAYGTVLAY